MRHPVRMDIRTDTHRMAQRPSPRTPGSLSVSTGQAAKLAGVSSRTIRRWIERGYLPAQQTARGWLLSPADLVSAKEAARLAEETSHTPDGHADTRSDARWDVPSATNGDTDKEADVRPVGHPVPMLDAARAQLEAIRDEWLAPLITQIRELERENGKLQAERDALSERLRTTEEKFAEAMAPVATPPLVEPPIPAPSTPARSRWRFWKYVSSAQR